MSRHRNHNENSETEIGKPPGLIENLVWLKKNWGKHKALIAIGLLLIAVPIALDLGPRVLDLLDKWTRSKKAQRPVIITDEACTRRDSDGYRIERRRHVSWTLPVGGSNSFLCMGMRPGSLGNATYVCILTMEGVPAEGDEHAFGQMELRQFDDSRPETPHHWQQKFCPDSERCKADTGSKGGVSSVQASLPIEVPETKNAIVEMHVTDARGGRTSHLQADGEFVVGTPNKL